MPNYDYQCQECGKVKEYFFLMDAFPDKISCSDNKCGGTAKKIITNGHASIQCDSIIDVSWLPSALEVLQPDGERPLETRRQWKDYLVEKGLQPVE